MKEHEDPYQSNSESQLHEESDDNCHCCSSTSSAHCFPSEVLATNLCRPEARRIRDRILRLRQVVRDFSGKGFPANRQGGTLRAVRNVRDCYPLVCPCVTDRILGPSTPSNVPREGESGLFSVWLWISVFRHKRATRSTRYNEWMLSLGVIETKYISLENLLGSTVKRNKLRRNATDGLWVYCSSKLCTGRMVFRLSYSYKNEPGWLIRYIDGLRTGRRGFDSRQRQENFLFSTTSGPALGTIQPPIQLAPWALSHEVTRPEPWSWPLTSIYCRREKRWSYTSTLQYVYVIKAWRLIN
jgi:hypothetical protein